MIAHARYKLILQMLEKRASLTIPELEEMLGASPATIRRDLVFLERAGKIVRVHGAVLHPRQVKGEISYDRKSRSELDAKVAIARVAAGMAGEKETIFIDAGSTVFEAGRRLLGKSELTLYTNSIPLLCEGIVGSARVVAIGGEVRAVSRALVGATSLVWVERLTPDIAFVGASGMDPKNGPCTTELFEAEIKRAVVARARRVILLVDATKWERSAAIRYAGWSQIHDVITNHPPDETTRAHLARHKVRLHIAKK